jgi:hypothetical protein
MDRDLQVAVRTATLARYSAPADPQALPVGDTGRYADALHALATAGALAVRAGVIDLEALALTLPARRRQREPTLTLGNNSQALADRTRSR